jgi:hypothetical protein
MRGACEALQLAWGSLTRSVPGFLAKYTGTEYNSASKQFGVCFITDHLLVDIERKEVVDERKKSKVDDFTALLVIHYLINANPIPLSGKLISFHELYGGEMYYSAFNSSTVDLISHSFSDADAFLSAARMLNGSKRDNLGNIAVEIPVFSVFPITIVLWLGDSEVLPSANILFDDTANIRLPTEDIIAVAGRVTRRLVKVGKASDGRNKSGDSDGSI